MKSATNTQENIISNQNTKKTPIDLNALLE